MAGRETDGQISPRWLVLAGAMVVVLPLFVLNPDLRPVWNWAQDQLGYGGSHSDNSEAGRDLFHTGAAIGGRRNGQTYAEFDSKRDQHATTSFDGFGCLGSCDDHLAGYRWALRHEITAPKTCAGLSWGFVEGCAAYTLTPRTPSASGPAR